MNFNILFANASILEPPNFIMNRESGMSGQRFMLFHFVNPIEITINGKEIVTNPGAVILFTPDQPQIFHPFNGRLNHDYIDFELLDKSFFSAIHFPLNTIVYPRISKTITTTIKNINNIKTNEETGFEYEIDAMFSMLLLDIARTLNIKRNRRHIEKQNNLQETFEQMRLSLYTNPTHVTVASLAEYLGFSASYFNKKYKEILHTSPLKDINKARIEYAKTELLQNKDINSIVDSLGFANNEYFYRWFKQMTGLTPKEFIKKNSN